MFIDITPNDERWYDLKDLPNEEWRDVKDFEGLYQVSNYGRVKSLSRVLSYHNIITKTRILRPGKNSSYYYLVILCKNSKKYTKKVHRLVAEAFIPNPEQKPEVNHIRYVTINLCDNRVSNLEWVTSKENSQHTIRLNRQSKPPVHYGENNNASKKIYQYDIFGNLVKVWGCMRDVCEVLCIKSYTLRNSIRKNKPISDYIYKYTLNGGDDHAGNNYQCD